MQYYNEKKVSVRLSIEEIEALISLINEKIGDLGIVDYEKDELETLSDLSCLLNNSLPIEYRK